MKSLIPGIDLGTTYSAIAWVNEEGYSEIIPNREEENTTPSVVMREGAGYIIGKEAQKQALVRPEDVAVCAKRYLAKKGITFAGLTPREVSAKILRRLLDDATARLNRSIEKAVITIPAYFSATPTSETKAAGELAGIEVVKLLHEPEAAAIHFGTDRLNSGEFVLVCDLGGGTYDSTVLEMQGDTLQARRTRGAAELGGFDWTEKLQEMLSEQIEAQTGQSPEDDLGHWQHLFDLAEQLKRQLSSVDQAEGIWTLAEPALTFSITRPEFEARCVPLINQVIDKTAETLNDANVTGDQITHVLLVGGSSRLPAFKKAMQELTGKTPTPVRNPDEAVALGAAQVAHSFATNQADLSQGRIVISRRKSGDGKGKITIVPRTTHALGTMTYRQTEGNIEYEYDTIIQENAPIPAKVQQGGFLTEPGLESFQIPVLQLDMHNRPVEELRNYRFFPVPGRSQSAEIRIQFELDSDSIPHVTAYDAETNTRLDGREEPFAPPEVKAVGKPATVVLAIDCSSSMYGSKIQEAKQIMQELATKYVDLGRNWSISVVNFGGPSEIYPSQILLPPTQSLDSLLQIADQLTPGGGTPMAAGLDNVRHVLESARGLRFAIILTDGQPNDREQSVQTAKTFKSMQIKVATVPVGSGADREFLSQIGELESDIKVDDSGAGMANAVIDLLRKVD